MTARKKRLGRDLGGLLSKTTTSPAAASAEALRQIPVEQLCRGEYQPRFDMRQESLDDLADSIRAQGIVQPIVVRPVHGDAAARYEIVAGERRWRAAQLAGLDDVPAIVRSIGDEDAIAMALIENIQRENLNPLEECRALERLIGEFDLTHTQAAAAVGRSRAAVSNLLRLNELADRVKPLVEARDLDMGHARALLAIQDPVQQFAAARQVVDKGLSVRATERFVKRLREPLRKKKPAGGSADVRRLEMDVADRLGAKVRIEHRAKGDGRLVISYNSLDELDGILAHIR